eukprot:gene17782-biopygen18910
MPVPRPFRAEGGVRAQMFPRALGWAEVRLTGRGGRPRLQSASKKRFGQCRVQYVRTVYFNAMQQSRRVGLVCVGFDPSVMIPGAPQFSPFGATEGVSLMWVPFQSSADVRSARLRQPCAGNDVKSGPRQSLES